MLIVFSKASDCEMLPRKTPESVIAFLKENIGILDNAYGGNRNHYKEGGYIIYADDEHSTQHIRETVTTGFYEWVEQIDGYTIELHLLGDDFAVIFCYKKIIK